MSKYLVIVESPTKAKTIHNILGKDYEVSSSMGHVVDLPSNRLAVDIETNFTPHYHVIPGKEKIIKQLKHLAKGKEIIYIATDPDREGEAIGWHIKENLSKIPAKLCRIVFHEITQEALKEAFANPTDLDENKVNSQIARRVLDRIVGYYLSPLLWKKIVRGLSAGRVQSIALKFIVDREKEIAAFVPKTTYSVDVVFRSGEVTFKASLDKANGEKGVFETKQHAQACIEKIKTLTATVTQIIKKEVKRRPLAPFTTSLLQQDAFNKLRFSSQKTMLVAQKLYEGVQMGQEMVGLITYMRTDSFAIAPRAKQEAKNYISRYFGNDYLILKDYKYKEKKSAQLAHEAIRPTAVDRTPEKIYSYLSDDEVKLYDLIWRRFLASRMREAIFENTKVVLTAPAGEFSASSTRLLFDGFLKLFEKEETAVLPDLKEGQQFSIESCEILEHTTKPPPRFNDASLVKTLEEKGIGRPSTYAPTIYTLLIRNYIKRQQNYFIPTELGVKVSELLVQYFSEIINEGFTAAMEEKLDEVEEGRIEWHKILNEFYPPFKEKLDGASKLITKEVEFAGKNCPKCQSPLVVKWSRRGRFLSCSKFPQCRYAESITTEVTCPECKKGKLIERRNKRGQNFYGCSLFPTCRYTSRKLPETNGTNNNTDTVNNNNESQNSNDESISNSQ
jgi:DNA topoisomerase-1